MNTESLVLTESDLRQANAVSCPSEHFEMSVLPKPTTTMKIEEEQSIPCENDVVDNYVESQPNGLPELFSASQSCQSQPNELLAENHQKEVSCDDTQPETETNGRISSQDGAIINGDTPRLSPNGTPELETTSVSQTKSEVENKSSASQSTHITNGSVKCLAKPNGNVFSGHRVPFSLLTGEVLEDMEETDQNCIYLTNYRLYARLVKAPYSNYGQQQEQLINLPINGIDSIEIRDLLFLVVFTKYIESFVLAFPSTDTTNLWYRRLCDVQDIKIDNLFCFQFFKNLTFRSETFDNKIKELLSINQEVKKMYTNSDRFVSQEFERMKFASENWRICDLNKDFKFCDSYPKYFIVPSEITDKDLEVVANYRYSRRIPVVVWRSRRNGCVIARSSQPVVGWLGWRSSQDERLMKAMWKICNVPDSTNGNTRHRPHATTPLLCNGASSSDPSPHLAQSHLANTATDMNDQVNGLLTNGITHGSMNTSNGSLPQLVNNVNHLAEKSEQEVESTMKLLILDARSYTAAIANRAVGGGSECPDYYDKCEVRYMGLNNIHSIRKSYYSLRYICEAAQIDQSNWFVMLDGTKWFHNLASLLNAALVVVDAISVQERPVLVHCSDGWDRTPQVVALAELMLDPYYRTMEGFKVLVEREWLHFGHKFADRCRSSTLNVEPNERCPVFLQWLDCVHQLLRQFPCEFEFNVYFLIKLLYHSYSCLFGTFTCNNVQERVLHHVYDKTISIWSYFYLEKDNFINYLYLPKHEILRPSCRVKDIVFWTDVYVPPSGNASVSSFISYSDVCSPHVSHSQSSLFTREKEPHLALGETSIKQELECSADGPCPAQSKCDLNRSASCEELSKCGKCQCSHARKRLPTRNSLEKQSPLRRNGSDSCLSSRELSNDLDKLWSRQNSETGSTCGDSNRESVDTSNDTRDEVVEDDTHEVCHSSNGLLGVIVAKPEPFPRNIHTDDQEQVNSLPETNTLFGIDGQIIGKTITKHHLQQLINYHQRMIKSLTCQLTPKNKNFSCF